MTILDIFTMMNGDNDFPLCMSFFAITEGFSYLAQWVPPVDDRYNLSSFKKVFQEKQIPSVNLRNKETHFLITNPRQKWPQRHRLEHSSKTTSDHHKDSVPAERT